jgi:hypothetical protein
MVAGDGMVMETAEKKRRGCVEGVLPSAYRDCNLMYTIHVKFIL